MADLLLDDEQDLAFANGDLQLVAGDEETIQRAALIIESGKGEWKQHPLVGCDLVRMMEGRNRESEMRRIIRLQLEADSISFDFIRNRMKFT